MINSILNLFTASLSVFSEERQRHLMAQYQAKLAKVDEAKNAMFPYFNRDKIAKAEQELERFIKAYSKEFEIELSRRVF